MKKISIEAVERRMGSGYPSPYDEPCRERKRWRLGDAAGLTQFGVNLLRLPVGQWSSQRHWHSAEDEFVYVLEGEVVLVTDAGEEVLRAGDCVGFKAGVGEGHHLQNRGPAEAVILETKRVRNGGLLGLFSRPVFEVAAAIEEEHREAEALVPLVKEIMGLRQEVNRILQESATREATTSLPEPLGRWQSQLERKGVASEVAEELLRRAWESGPAEGEALRLRVARLVEEYFGLPQPIRWENGRTKVVALVGPTGVGKTTTLAKLAARFALAEKARVALIAADTYRIAAVEQIRTYAEILGVPVAVADTPAELRAALAGFQDRDILLVDTAGRSHQNAMQMAELRGVLEAIAPAEVFLIVSLATADGDLLEILKEYQDLGFDRLLLTKLDETRSPGRLLNLAVRAGKPFSYITAGQRVPEDLELASASYLTNLLLGDIDA